MTTNQTKGWTTRWIRLLALLQIGCLTLAFAQSAQAQDWIPRADMTSARANLAAGVVNGQIYLFGGSLDESDNDPTRTRVEAYDPATDTWSQKAEIPLPKITVEAATLGGKIYVLGTKTFGTGERELLVYDPATDTWEQKADMPVPLTVPGLAGVDGKLYVIGGKDEERTGFWGSSRVFMYDPATDNWSQKADMPQIAFWLLDSVSVVDGKIYVMGIYRELFATPLRQVYVYDPGSDSWSQKADMPTRRVSPATAVVDGKIYVIGGGTTAVFEGDHALVEVYDPATDTWLTEAVPPINTPRASAVAAAMDGTIYVFGGWAGRKVSLASVEAFDTGTGATAIEAWGWGAIKERVGRSPLY